MRVENPFLTVGYRSPEFFCDREQETEQLKRALWNNNNVTLYAARRIGKSGLIHNVFYQLKTEHPEIYTFYLDIYSTHNLSDFVKQFANAILYQLDSAPERAAKKFVQLIGGCRPVISFDQLTGQPQVILTIEPNAEEYTLERIFNYLKSSGKRCYIAFDEFQQVANYPEKGTEALLRSYIQWIDNVNFIFCGSQQHLMGQMFLSPSRPFFHSTQMMHLDVIDRKKYLAFANHHLQANSQTISAELFNWIYDRFRGYTWYIQSVLHNLFELAQPISETLVAKAVDMLIRQNEAMYQMLIRQLTDTEYKLLKAVSKRGIVKEITAGEFLKESGLKAASSVKRPLSNLIKADLISLTPEGYIPSDLTMAMWMTQQ